MTPSRGAPPPDPAPDEVPRLPRGRGLRLSRVELLRIAGLAVLLVFLLATQRQCASAVSRFVTSFGEPAASPGTPGTSPGSGASADPAVGSGLDLDRYEHLRPGMTDAEMKAVIERARARAAGRRDDAAPAH